LEEYCQRVYQHLGDETIGDMYAISALVVTYQEKLLEIKKTASIVSCSGKKQSTSKRRRTAKAIIAFST
jgi:hypothetical protein